MNARGRLLPGVEILEEAGLDWEKAGPAPADRQA